MHTPELNITRANGQLVPLYFEPISKAGAEERALSFTKRSIKNKAKLGALYQIIKMMDLTTLEGADTPGKVKQLCAKAKYPLPQSLQEQLEKYEGFESVPSVAAVCVYPEQVATAVKALRGTAIHVASVATAFPSGQAHLRIKLEDTRAAVMDGADEIDMVINRGAFLSGRYQQVFDEIAAIKDACGHSAHLKVILETGELGTYDHVRLASEIAMAAGADFIKTSTGKISSAATLPVTYIMLQAIERFYERTGKKIGMKPAGGIRTAKLALSYMCMVNETVGYTWLTPDLYRFGASSLLNDVLKQIFKQYTGTYCYDYAFSVE